MDELKALTVASFVALVLVVAISAMVMSDSSRIPHATRSNGADALSGVNVSDKIKGGVTSDQTDQARVMPLFLQSDPQWEGKQYGSDTIRDSGCGLCCAAMAFSYCTGYLVSPDGLADYVGDSAMVYSNDGSLVNDMGAFGQYGRDLYGLQVSDIYYDVDEAMQAVKDGGVVWCGMHGELADAMYDGHVVLLYANNDGVVLLRDPASEKNSTSEFREDYLKEYVSWDYFYTVREGE